jgi:hypothetical protein
VFLSPDETASFIPELSKRNVTLKEVFAKDTRLMSIKLRMSVSAISSAQFYFFTVLFSLQAILAQEHEIKKFAQGAFKSYIRSLGLLKRIPEEKLNSEELLGALGKKNIGDIFVFDPLYYCDRI